MYICVFPFFSFYFDIKNENYILNLYHLLIMQKRLVNCVVHEPTYTYETSFIFHYPEKYDKLSNTEMWETLREIFYKTLKLSPSEYALECTCLYRGYDIGYDIFLKHRLLVALENEKKGIEEKETKETGGKETKEETGEKEEKEETGKNDASVRTVVIDSMSDAESPEAVVEEYDAEVGEQLDEPVVESVDDELEVESLDDELDDQSVDADNNAVNLIRTNISEIKSKLDEIIEQYEQSLTQQITDECSVQPEECLLEESVEKRSDERTPTADLNLPLSQPPNIWEHAFKQRCGIPIGDILRKLNSGGRTRVVVAGGFAIQTLLGEQWPTSDIDLFTECADELKEELQYYVKKGRGGFYIRSMTAKQYYASLVERHGMSKPGRSQIGKHIESKYNATASTAAKVSEKTAEHVYTDRLINSVWDAESKSTGFHIQIIDTKSVVKSLEAFDSDTCVCGYDGYHTFIKNHLDLYNKVIQTSFMDEKRREKYRQRGFTIHFGECEDFEECDE